MKHIRSLLCVPAHKPRTFEKAEATAADCLMYDLEDSVPPQHKDAAMHAVALQLHFSSPKRIWLRVNPEVDRLRAEIRAFAPYVHAIVLPKVDCAAKVSYTRRLTEEVVSGGVPVVPVIETTRAIVNLATIASVSSAFIFGIADYAASLGVSDRLGAYGYDSSGLDTYERFAYARQKIATYAAAHGIQALDTCFIVKGGAVESRAWDCWREARAIGFTGAACIHPAQIAPANAVFQADSERVWAEQTSARFTEGAGEVHVDSYGLVVGRPVARQAESILKRRDA